MLSFTSDPDQPAPVAYVAELMSTFRATWFLCGGWAVDAWLGRQTRDHGDVDITVFHDHQRTIFEHLAGWHLIAHGPNVPGDTTEPWDGRSLELPAHIHARPDGGDNLEAVKRWVSSPGAQPHDALNLEILLNKRSGHDWLLNADPPIALHLDRCFRKSASGLPIVVAEILMFYKATAYWGTPGHPRRRDEADFLALLPQLSEKQRQWLSQAISIAQPGHPWLAQLSR